MVDINTQNTNFVDGQVTVGFGTGDVTVNHLWVIGPTHLQANVVWRPTRCWRLRVQRRFGIPGGCAAVRVSDAGGESEPAFHRLPIVNAVPTQQTLYPGAFAAIYGSNLALSPSAAQVTLNNVPVQILYASATQINFVIPPVFRLAQPR